ncbi:MAG: cell division protein FtsQ/DivIB [Candidatus Dormibacteria bacterium]
MVEEVARQAAARRAARLAARQRLFGRVRLSAPKAPRWLDTWGGLVLPLRLLSIGLVLALLGAVAAFNLPWLKVQRVQLEGSSVLARSQLLAVAGVHLGESTIMLDTERMTVNLLAQPWVAAASVRVRWPGTLVVSVTPLPPVLIYQRGSSRELLASTGAVLGPVPQTPTLSPVPTLVDQGRGGGVAPGHTALPANLTAALAALYRAFPAAYGVSVSQFIMSPVGVLEIKSSAGWVADLGPAVTAGQIASIGPKLEALRALAAKVNLKSAAIKTIYLEDPAQVVVSP